MTLVRAVVANDVVTVERLLGTAPDLAHARIEEGAARQAAAEYYFEEIEHYAYAGDSALHIAAAAHRPDIVRILLAAGVRRHGPEPAWRAAASLRRRWPTRLTPVGPAGPGRDRDLPPHGGRRPECHRQERCHPVAPRRSYPVRAAVGALVDGGADPRQPNKKGSTPAQLATWMTGRGGSGAPVAKAQQEEIIDLLERYGAATGKPSRLE
jgi:hypothetical protein